MELASSRGWGKKERKKERKKEKKRKKGMAMYKAQSRQSMWCNSTVPCQRRRSVALEHAVRPFTESCHQV